MVGSSKPPLACAHLETKSSALPLQQQSQHASAVSRSALQCIKIPHNATLERALMHSCLARTMHLTLMH